MARVLFINPPVIDSATEGAGADRSDALFNRSVRWPSFGYATPFLHPPLWLATAAAYIRDHGFEVGLIDAVAERLSLESFLKKTTEFQPDFLVFEVSAASLPNDAEVITHVTYHLSLTERQQSPAPSGITYNLRKPRIILVGPHCSALPEETLRAVPEADAVVIGEYEITLKEYLFSGLDVGLPFRVTEEGHAEACPTIPGICYRLGDKIINNGPRPFLSAPGGLDEIPFAARDLLPNEKYFDPVLDNPFTFVLAGRGCPHQCIYCHWPQSFTGRKYRVRSPIKVVDEIEDFWTSGVRFPHNTKRQRSLAPSGKGGQGVVSFKSFMFNDDTFTANPANTQAICEEIINRGLKVKWGAYVRADFDNEPVLRLMKQAGCYLLGVGIESASPEILKQAKKGWQITQAEKTVKLLKKLGFQVHLTFMFGLPGETEETIRQTVVWARKLNPRSVQFSTAIPYPGTEFYNFLRKNGLLLSEVKSGRFFLPMQPLYEYENLSAQTLAEAVPRAYRQYYFRPGYWLRGAKEMFNRPREVFKSLNRLFKFVYSTDKHRLKETQIGTDNINHRSLANRNG